MKFKKLCISNWIIETAFFGNIRDCIKFSVNSLIQLATSDGKKREKIILEVHDWPRMKKRIRRWMMIVMNKKNSCMNLKKKLIVNWIFNSTCPKKWEFFAKISSSYSLSIPVLLINFYILLLIACRLLSCCTH